MQTLISVAIAVVEHENQFLVGRRAKCVPLGGLWEFPGGKIEKGESPEAAAARECLEETGIRVEVSHRLVVNRQEYAHARIQLSFFACELLDPDAATPRAPFEWIARAKLAELEFPEGNQPLLERLLG